MVCRYNIALIFIEVVQNSRHNLLQNTDHSLLKTSVSVRTRCYCTVPKSQASPKEVFDPSVSDNSLQIGHTHAYPHTHAHTHMQHITELLSGFFSIREDREFKDQARMRKKYIFIVVAVLISLFPFFSPCISWLFIVTK